MTVDEQVAENLGRAIRATRQGTCSICQKAIEPSNFDVIAEVPDRGWAHADCAARWLEQAPDPEPAAEADPVEIPPAPTFTAASYTVMRRAFQEVARARGLREFDVRMATTIYELGGEATTAELHDHLDVTTEVRRSATALYRGEFAKGRPLGEAGAAPEPGKVTLITLTPLGIDLVEEWREACARPAPATAADLPVPRSGVVGI